MSNPALVNTVISVFHNSITEDLLEQHAANRAFRAIGGTLLAHAIYL